MFSPVIFQIPSKSGAPQNAADCSTAHVLSHILHCSALTLLMALN